MGRLKDLSRPKCVHCGRYYQNRPRGLCNGCYFDFGVRQRYPAETVYSRKGEAADNRKRPLPSRPTSAGPGTPEKIQVLEARVAAGEQLWHPEDATGQDGTHAEGMYYTLLTRGDLL